MERRNERERNKREKKRKMPMGPCPMSQLSWVWAFLAKELDM